MWAKPKLGAQSLHAVKQLSLAVEAAVGVVALVLSNW